MMRKMRYIGRHSKREVIIIKKQGKIQDIWLNCKFFKEK
jgi:peroxiredoxin